MNAPDPRTSAGPSAELGRLLVRIRTERGLAQKQVAQRAEIDNSTLSRLEAGERGVSRDVLERIVTVLDLDRRQRLDVLVAAGFLIEEAARLLADEDLARVARVLTDPATRPEDRALLRSYLVLALAHASALGYEVDE